MRCISGECPVHCRKMLQYEMYRSVPGLENAKIMRNAYAIEYDCIDARQLYPTLEFKKYRGALYWRTV